MKEVAPEDRCTNVFEVKPKGLRYVTRRWRCKRKKLKGQQVCSYCELPHKKQERLAKKAAAKLKEG